jgi:hypothetical protein
MRGPLITALLLFALPNPAEAKPEASTFKKETRLGPNYWNAKSAIDNNLETSWQVPGDSPNVGEWIAFDIPKGNVDAIKIYPGWGKSDETYTDYARLKKAHIEILCCIDSEQMSSLFTAEIDIEDKAEHQIIDLVDTAVGNDLFGGKLRLTVKEFYPGRDYPNLAISEIQILMKEFDAATTITGLAADSDPLNMTDDNARTVWTGPADASMMLEADGFGLSSVMIQSGPKPNARIKRIKVTANDRSVEHEMADNGEVQYVPIPSIMGYNGSAWGEVQVEIIEVYPGDNPDVSIAELKLRATNYEGI